MRHAMLGRNRVPQVADQAFLHQSVVCGPGGGRVHEDKENLLAGSVVIPVAVVSTEVADTISFAAASEGAAYSTRERNYRICSDKRWPKSF